MIDYHIEIIDVSSGEMYLYYGRDIEIHYSDISIEEDVHYPKTIYLGQMSDYLHSMNGSKNRVCQEGNI